MSLLILQVLFLTLKLYDLLSIVNLTYCIYVLYRVVIMRPLSLFLVFFVHAVNCCLDEVPIRLTAL